jgi:hypothetical protein
MSFAMMWFVPACPIGTIDRTRRNNLAKKSRMDDGVAENTFLEL